jgi:hypothetical protein
VEGVGEVGGNMRIERFEDIEAWQLARELSHEVYCLTRKVPFAGDYGLKGQIQGLLVISRTLKLTEPLAPC